MKNQIDIRHEKVADKKDLMIQMDPDIAKVFRESTAISSKYSKLSLTHISFNK